MDECQRLKAFLCEAMVRVSVTKVVTSLVKDRIRALNLANVSPMSRKLPNVSNSPSNKNVQSRPKRKARFQLRKWHLPNHSSSQHDTDLPHVLTISSTKHPSTHHIRILRNPKLPGTSTPPMHSRVSHQLRFSIGKQ